MRERGQSRDRMAAAERPATAVGRVTRRKAAAVVGASRVPGGGGGWGGGGGGGVVRLPRKCTIKFINNDPLHAYFIVWMDHDGRAVPRMRLDPGSTLVESTFALHPWRILGIPRGGIPRRSGGEGVDGEGEQTQTHTKPTQNTTPASNTKPTLDMKPEQ